MINGVFGWLLKRLGKFAEDQVQNDKIEVNKIAAIKLFGDLWVVDVTLRRVGK